MTEDDLKLIENRFYDYTNAFAERAQDTFPFTLKQEHTLRVCENILMLAGSLGLQGQMVMLAHAAALAHDMGRFPQFEIYGTYSDALSKNHAALGTGVLVTQGILKGMDRGDRRLILRAVALHNRAALPVGLPQDLDLLSRLLRDADKIDIYKVMKDHYLSAAEKSKSFLTHNLPDDGQVSTELVSMLMEERPIHFNEVNTLNDMKLFQVGMIQDLNFPAAFRAVMEMGIVGVILGSMPGTQTLDELARVMTGRMVKAAGLN